jgi:ribonuclease BN (tRNA processing enzyme)
MRVFILGVGDAFTRKHFGTSAVNEAPNTAKAGQAYVMIDCPDLIHRALHELSQRIGRDLDVTSIDDILLTHLHGDHCNGLESFGFYRRIHRLNNPQSVRPRLHATQPVADRVWERLAPAMETPIGDTRTSTLDDYFEMRILTPGVVSKVAGLDVDCRFTKHPVPTVGFFITHGRGSLGWSSDTPFEQAHVDWLARADVIAHESNVGPSHTPIEKLKALPPEVRRKIRLIHLPDDFDSRSTDMTVLREGDVLEL